MVLRVARPPGNCGLELTWHITKCDWVSLLALWSCLPFPSFTVPWHHSTIFPRISFDSSLRHPGSKFLEKTICYILYFPQWISPKHSLIACLNFFMGPHRTLPLRFYVICLCHVLQANLLVQFTLHLFWFLSLLLPSTLFFAIVTLSSQFVTYYTVLYRALGPWKASQ